MGYEKANSNFSPNLIKDKTAQYYFSKELSASAWNLQGLWQVNAENIIAKEANASIKIHFNARKVFVVMGNDTAKPIKIKVILMEEGKKIKEHSLLVDKYSLYEVVSQQQFSDGYLELIADEPGITIYTFTFGS